MAIVNGPIGLDKSSGLPIFVAPEKKIKPLLGLRPKYIVDELRLQEIAEAIYRYTEERHPIPNEWIEEWNELSTSKNRR